MTGGGTGGTFGAVATYSLRVIDGPAAGARIAIHARGTVVGRAAGGRLAGDPLMSQRHARFIPTRRGLLLEDLGSTNGTYVNGSRVSAPVTVTAGDIVEVGETVLEVADSETEAWPGSDQAAGETMARGGVAVGGGVHADRGSIGAIGEMHGDVDMRRQTVRAERGGYAAGGDIHHEEHEYDVSGLRFLSRASGAARFFMVLGAVVSLAGMALFAYPIVRALSNTSSLGPSSVEVGDARRDCEQRNPDVFGPAYQRCVEAAFDAQSGEGFGIDVTPWIPLGLGLAFVGIALGWAGFFLIGRDRRARAALRR